MSKAKAIISDADGTLINTLFLIRHGQYETAKNYLLLHGIDENQIPSYDEHEKHLHQVLGGSARETLERTIQLIYKDSPTVLDSIDFDALHDLLNPIQDKIAPEYVKAYPGLSELLNFMGKNKIDLAVFTSGTPHHIVRNFGVALPELGQTTLYLKSEKTDLEKLKIFEEIMQSYYSIHKVTFVTCDDISANKPDPESLLLGLDRLGVEKSEALVLGDHWVDMQAGVNADITTRIGISHGFDDRDALTKAGATAIIDSLAELEEII